MSVSSSMIEELVSNGGFQLEELQRRLVDEIADEVLDCLVERACLELSDELERDLVAVEIDTSLIADEVDGLSGDVEYCMMDGSSGKDIEEDYYPTVLEAVREQVEAMDAHKE